MGGHSQPSCLPQWCPQAHWGPGHRWLSIPHPPELSSPLSPTSPLGAPPPPPPRCITSSVCGRTQSTCSNRFLRPRGGALIAASTGSAQDLAAPALSRGKSPEPGALERPGWLGSHPGPVSVPAEQSWRGGPGPCLRTPSPISLPHSSTMRRSSTSSIAPATLTPATASPTSRSTRTPAAASTPPALPPASSAPRRR